MTKAFFNGNYLPLDDVHISPLDRGFLFGDSVYEVVPAYHQKTLGAEMHYTRLIRSLSEIGIESPYSCTEWQEVLAPLLSAENEAEKVYVQVTRGVETTRKHRLPVDVPPTVLAFTIPFTPPISLDYEGCQGHLQDDLRWGRCDIKSTSLMGNIHAYYELYQKGMGNEEVLLVRDGNVVEAPSSNVFAVIDNVVVTPPFDNILAGVTRHLVMEDAKRLGLGMVELPIPVETLSTASEVWVTNSYEELKPIVAIDGKPVGDGKPDEHWRALYQAFQARKQTES